MILPRHKPGLSIKEKAAQILLMVSLAAKLIPPMMANETRPQMVLVVICSIATFSIITQSGLFYKSFLPYVAEKVFSVEKICPKGQKRCLEWGVRGHRDCVSEVPYYRAVRIRF